MGLYVQSMVTLRKVSVVKSKMIWICGIGKNIATRGRSWNALKYFGAILLICMLTLSLLLSLRAVTFRLGERMENHNDVNGHGGNVTLEGLALTLVREIERLSNPSSCENTSTLYCGYRTGCGLGCNLNHRAICLILSYSMRIPLIHDTTKWPFGKWEDTFQPLGSRCPPNERTITFEWFDKKPGKSFNKSIGKEYFLSGIQVDQNLLRAVQDIHPSPTLWFVGQFLKYTMRLSSKLAPVVNEFINELPHSSPLVGLHIRRTDKIEQVNGSYHDIKDYIIPADAYFRRVNCSVNRTVYLASDNHKMLSHVQKLYPLPHWRFTGLNMSKTFHTEKSRRNPRALISIIKDVVALAKCDYVVCGFTSYICRMILELMNADHRYGFERVKSLDVPYKFEFLTHSAPFRLVPRVRQE